MARGREVQRLLTVLVVIGALVTPGAAEASAEEVDVKIGAIFDQSGPTSDAGIPYSEGVRDYVEWYNAQGREPNVALMWQDSGYKAPVAVELYSKFVADGAVGIIGWGTADTDALRPRVNSDQIPFMSAAYPETLTNPQDTPYNFVDAATWSDQMRVTLLWIAHLTGGKHAEVAVFHHDSPFGTSPVEDGRRYVAENNLDLGYQTYPMRAGATDFVAELDKAKAQGAAYVVVQNVSAPAAKLARNIADGKYGMRMICLDPCGDELLIKRAGAAAESVAAVMPFAPPGTEAPGMKTLRDHLAGKGKKLEDQGVHYVQGWFTTAAMVQAGVTTSERSGPAIKARLESSDGVDTGGVASGPIKFSAGSHKGMDGARLFQVRDGRWVPATDPLTP